VGAQGLNKKALQQLSMLERRIAKGNHSSMRHFSDFGARVTCCVYRDAVG
jgi:hypothetical protein